MTMKKALTCGLALDLVLSVGSYALACGGYSRRWGGTSAPTCPAYGTDCPRQDADGDGLCDLCGGAEACALCDADGDGLCDLCGQAHHHAAGVHGQGGHWGGGRHGGRHCR